MATNIERLLKYRLLAHRLSSQHRFNTVEEAIQSFLCMQAQDEAMTVYSIIRVNRRND